MKNDLKIVYWIIILGLLLIPVTNSFVVVVKNVVDSYILNLKHKESLSKLNYENRNLRDKVKYYASGQGKKALVKDRLHMVEEGECLVKYHFERNVKN